MKKFIVTLLIATMFISTGITGFALQVSPSNPDDETFFKENGDIFEDDDMYEGEEEDNGIYVDFNGEFIDFEDAMPIDKNDRVMVPFSKIFSTMGANVKYENNTIIATLGKKTLKIKENQQMAELISDGKSEMIDMKVPAFVDNVTNRAYVPVSTISTVFGFDVYWDPYYNTVNVIDSKKLISEIDSKYTLYNKLAKASKTSDNFNKTYKTSLDGEFNMSIGKELSGEEKEMVLAAKANIEALSKGSNVSIKGNVKVDTSNNDSSKQNIARLSPDFKNLENIPFEFILNTDTKKMYFKTGEAIFGNEENKNKWHESPLDENMMAAMGQLKLGMSSSSDLTIGQLLYSLAWTMKDDVLNEQGEGVYGYVKKMESICNMIIADDLFTNTKEGTVDVHTVSLDKAQMLSRLEKYEETNEFSSDQLYDLFYIAKDLNYKFVIKENNGKIVDSSLDINFKFSEDDNISAIINAKGNMDKSDIKLIFKMGSSKAEMTLKIINVETNEIVKSAPPEGEEIVKNDNETIQTEEEITES